MYSLNEVLDHVDNTNDSDTLVKYLAENTWDSLSEEFEELGLTLSYEDFMEQSVHSLAEYVLDNV